MKSKLLASEVSGSSDSEVLKIKQIDFLLFINRWKGLFVLLAMLFLAPAVMGQTFTEDFESGIPSDWGLYNDGAASINWQHFQDGYESSGSAFINPAEDNLGDTNTGSYYLVTPYITLPENPVLYFKTQYGVIGNDNTKYKVMISTAPQPDLNDFILAEEWTAEDVEDYLEYNTKMVSLDGLSEGMQIYVAFVLENTQEGSEGSGVTWWVDDIMMASTCTGVSPDTLEYYNITTSSAEIMWEHPTSTYFDIQVVEEDESPEVNGGEYLNSFIYSADGLSPETIYDVYIRTHCAEDIDSGWELVGSFETLKYGMTCAFPIELGNSYSFEGNINEFPNVNMDSYSSHGSSCFPVDITDNYLAGNKIFFSYTAEESGVINIQQNTWPWQAGTTCYGNSQSAVLIYDSCDNVGVECLAALRTTDTDQPRTIDNYPVEAGETYIIVLSTLLDGIDASICFDFTFEFSQCPSPTEIVYSNLLEESVRFSWDNPNDLANEWEYLVLTADADAPSATTSGTTTSVNENVTVTGLESDTAYKFYVRPTCSGSEGEWTSGYEFRTQCATFDLPYITGFVGTSETNPEPCWTVIDVNQDDQKWTFMTGWDVPNYVSLWTATSQNNNHDYLISPRLNIPNSDIPKKIRFKQQVTGWEPVASFSVKASTTGIGVANFTEEIIAETEITSEAWETVTYTIPAHIHGEVNIAWIVSPTTGETASRVSITDLEVYEECNEPSNLGVEDTTLTSALLTWIPYAVTDSEWEVVVKLRGEEAPLITDTGVIADTNNFWYEDLSDSTRYEFYVRTSCTDTAKSDWVGPFEFFTLCSPVTEPYVETFDLDIDEIELNNPDTKRYCWAIEDANSDGITWEFTDTEALINLNAGSNDDWLISPAIILDGDFHEVKFKHKSTEAYDLEVLVSENGMDLVDFENLLSLEDNQASNDYNQAQHYFEAAGEVYIAIRVSPEMTATADQTITIDHFEISVASPCPQPYDVERDAQTNTFTWTPGDQESQWEVVIVPDGQPIPSRGVVVDEPTYTAEDLEEASAYNFYVKAICDVNNISEWTGPFPFVTTCSTVFSTPFIETFEEDSESVYCWQANGGWLLQNVLTPYEGEHAANIYTWDPVPGRWLISPAIEVGENEMLSFYYKASQYAPDYSEDLKVWLSTTGNTEADFTTLLFEDTDFGHTAYKQGSVALPEDISGQIYIAFEIPIEIANLYGFRQNVFLDNIEVKPIPECPQPYNIEVSLVQDTSFELTFETIGDVQEWEVLVLPYATENPFDDIDEANIHTITSNPGTVSGLDPATAYDVYIRPVCSDDNLGDWSELIPILTMCDFDNQCLYTFVLHSGDFNTMGIAGGIDVIQNGYTIQTLEFPTAAAVEIVQPIEYQVYLCDGVEFTLHWDSFGWAPNQYPEAYVKVIDPNGNEQWMSEMGVGRPRADIYTGIAICSDQTCEQPTNLSVDESGTFSWTAGSDETQWEVYIQPAELGALPSEGMLVTETTYTPTAEDLILGPEGAYEFFVRAVCSEDDMSFWSGPTNFILNDDSSNAIIAVVNDTDICDVSVDSLTFNGSTASDDDLSIELERNSGDVWVEFTAISETHQIELGNFSGRHDDAGYSQLPRIIMVLYKELEDGSLEEIGWSDNNVLRTMYATETEIGETYKIRLVNTNDEVPNTRTFSLCITTIDACKISAPNYSFETPGMLSSFSTEMIYFDNVVPGWRDNSRVLNGTVLFWGTENDFFEAFHRGQMVQLPFQDEEGYPEPPVTGATDVVGLYQDFDSSEVQEFDYSFAYRRRPAPMFDVPGTRVLQLYAGPIDGPYDLVLEGSTTEGTWSTKNGKYQVPEGQDKTRFIFRTKNKHGAIVLDAANFVANNDITSVNHSLTCINPETLLKAVGFGEWEADENNPADVVIEDVTSNETQVRGFATPGEYVFYWNTRYCQDSITITYQGIEETPEVESPITYCVGDEAAPLTASAVDGYSLVFYTQEFDGEPMDTVIPDTSEAGETVYYVAYVDADGCEGARVPIQVLVNDNTEAVTFFEYDNYSFCPDALEPELILPEDFTYGGIFTVSPSGLTIDAQTGYIDIASSATGVYQVTYTIESDDSICLIGDSYTIDVEVVADIAFSIYNFCDSSVYMLGVEFEGGETPELARYVWTDDSGIVIGTEATLDVVAAFGGNVVLPSNIQLSVELGDCIFTESITIESAMCEIPKGISPNGDGLNDSFDLSGLGVQKLVIFNRYGTKVYTKDNYTNEWAGQSDKGKDLPDGTYYYVIETKAGESITGWVYLNRAY